MLNTGTRLVILDVLVAMLGGGIAPHQTMGYLNGALQKSAVGRGGKHMDMLSNYAKLGCVPKSTSVPILLRKGEVEALLN